MEFADKPPGLDFLKTRKPKVVSVSQESLVRITPEGAGWPPVVEPGVESLSLAQWAANNRDFVTSRLRHHGALLFRGFEVAALAQFAEFAAAVSPELIAYGERSSPRTSLGGGVYTSTDHPPDQPIVLHNEQSYTFNWPMKIFFYCVRPAQSQGRTPIADSRKIYARLPRELIEQFEARQVLYVRNYGDGLGLPWQEVFQTDSESVVEEYCRETAIECVWKPGGRLQTRQVRPAVRRHPATGETVWFNHAYFFHVSSLAEGARAALLAAMDEDELPFNTYYGDGAPFEPRTLETIRRAYDAETVSFEWRPRDVLLLDNMLTAHGREPFVGPRKIAVIMSEPFASHGGAPDPAAAA